METADSLLAASQSSSRRRRSHHSKSHQYDATAQRRKYQKLYDVFVECYLRKTSLVDSVDPLLLHQLSLQPDDLKLTAAQELPSYVQHRQENAHLQLFMDRLIDHIMLNEPLAGGGDCASLTPSDLAGLTGEGSSNNNNDSADDTTVAVAATIDTNHHPQQQQKRPAEQQEETLVAYPATKLRAVTPSPRALLQVPDTDVYTFVATRFHACHLPTSTQERLYNVVLSLSHEKISTTTPLLLCWTNY